MGKAAKQRKKTSTAHTLDLAVPQAILPSLDKLTGMLLERLRPDTEVFAGVRQTVTLLLSPRPKPLLIVITTDCCKPVVMTMLNNLRILACLLKVPVVHAMTRNQLGESCRFELPVTVACVAAVLDEPAVRLLNAVLLKVTEAYRMWTRRAEEAAGDAAAAAACCALDAGLEDMSGLRLALEGCF